VIDRAAAGRPPCQTSAVRLEERRAAFPEEILVPADDHRPVVLPEIEDGFILLCVRGQIRLAREILIGVKPLGDECSESRDHASGKW
jgi:hypothetical protein